MDNWTYILIWFTYHANFVNYFFIKLTDLSSRLYMITVKVKAITPEPDLFLFHRDGDGQSQLVSFATLAGFSDSQTKPKFVNTNSSLILLFFSFVPFSNLNQKRNKQTCITERKKSKPPSDFHANRFILTTSQMIISWSFDSTRMHPIYCVTQVPDRTYTTAAAATTPQSLSDLLNMPPPPPPHPNTPSLRSLSTHSFRISTDHSRLIKRSNSSALERSTRQTASLSLRDMDVVINDIVGSGISGVLYKWVNYGRGWRPRWFVLQDGVLSYYKIHGPDKIAVNHETERGSMVIGEESFRRLSRSNRTQSRLRKPVGEIHLKVFLSFFMPCLDGFAFFSF